METIYKGILIIHVLCGFTALTTGIVPMIAKKGGKQHNRWGNVYYWAMFGVFITTIGLFSIKFQEVKLQFFLAVAVASFYQTFTGVRILKSKKTGLNPQRLDWIAAYLCFGFGIACFGYMVWKITQGNTFMGVLFAFFGVICTSHAWQDLRVFAGKIELEKMHWFFQHIARMAGSYTATLTAFLVNMSRFFPEWSHLMVWILPGVLASFIIRRVIRQYREKFGLEHPTTPIAERIEKMIGKFKTYRISNGGTKISIMIIGFCSLMYMFGCTSVLFFPDKSNGEMGDNYLTKTKWQQMGGFEKFTPDSLRVGCWSTALAQIVYYHKLKPFGQVQYTSRQGYTIDENLDSTQFDFGLFTSKIDINTPPQMINQLAKYSYYAAVVVQKDFGTDRYMNKLASADLLEQHYKMQVKRFVSWHKYLPNTLGKLEKVIYKEINAKRPVFLHFANLKNFGHSVVLDGYCYKNGTFMIHTNQGQGGEDDGWYDFYKGILRQDDDKLRVVYTFRPQ